MLLLVIPIFVARISLNVLQKVISLYDCDRTIMLDQVHWLILYFLRSLGVFFWIFVAGMLLSFSTRNDLCLLTGFKWFLCMIVKWLLSYRQFIHLFFTYLKKNHMNHCSLYVCGCYYKKWLLCMIVQFLLSCIQFIDRFFTCLYLSVVPFN